VLCQPLNGDHNFALGPDPLRLDERGMSGRGVVDNPPQCAVLQEVGVKVSSSVVVPGAPPMSRGHDRRDAATGRRRRSSSARLDHVRTGQHVESIGRASEAQIRPSKASLCSYAALGCHPQPIDRRGNALGRTTLTRPARSHLGLARARRE
jgi:hypothetical protein